MREIKFRAYNGMEWIYSMTVSYDVETDTHYMLDPFFVDCWIMCGRVGQYTGLKDKNGVEIYEGDILDYAGEKKSVLMFEIVYHHGGFKRKWLNDTPVKVRGLEIESLAWNTSVIFEVIGNIHEHPHLLETKK